MQEDYQARELFHLLFISHLAKRLQGRAYAVKGGICLRFFHRSPRLSEDMDIDTAKLPRETLSRAVQQILSARAFASHLDARQLTLFQVTTPKQTETTQRWKIQLKVQGRLLSTRLEFSARAKQLTASQGIPHATLLAQHGLQSFVAQYYNQEEMIGQKLRALAAPKRNAARDIFDLWHLLKQSHQKASLQVGKEIVEAAIDKILATPFATFTSEVVPFLPSDLGTYFSQKTTYQQLMDDIVGVL